MRSPMSSRDGKTWTPQEGLTSGIPTISTITPPTLRVPSSSSLTDVIVIGAGYAGLTAARDLAIQGHSVLLLEARDRIGGRTWNSTIDGYNYDMGGTWIHWHMPHIYREVSLYGLHDDWVITPQTGGRHDYCTIGSRGQKRNISHEEEAAIFAKVWGLFCNVDGASARSIIPWPFDGMKNRSAVEKVDKLSCADRIEQIKDQLSTEEIDVLRAILLQMGGGPLEEMGLLDALRWYALGGYIPLGLNDIGLYTRLKSGQSALARRIFDHTVSTGKLSYSFSTPVAFITEKGDAVAVTARSGQTWKARKVICTVPLNVLADVKFSPPLPGLKSEALKVGHTNRGNKTHAVLKGDDLSSWTSFNAPGKGMICAISDGLTPSGDAHLVTFGPVKEYSNGISLSDNINGVLNSVSHLFPLEQSIERLVFHDWANDEFAKGTWCYFKPEFASKYLEALQRPHGNVHFANADWSDGWRGWIDGAVQQGTEVAKTIDQWLRQSTRSNL